RDKRRVVLQDQVERGRVWLVVDQLGSVDIEDLDSKAQDGSELCVRPQMVRGAGEPNQRVMATGLGIDALRIGRRYLTKDLDFASDDAERLRVGAPDGPPSALPGRRFTNLRLPEINDARHVLAELRIEGLDLGR